MVKAYAVIGANYGDEGKGLVTDYLARNVDHPYVIRFNGGAQAGHTVVTPEGKRHIFSHFGSGTLAGAPTFLTRHFISNPILFNREWEVLKSMGVDPIVNVCPYSLVTTPFDMMINQAVETVRGASRHGSCGAGIFETIYRSSHDVDGTGFWLTYRTLDIFHKNLRRYMEQIRDKWVPHRLNQLGLTSEEIDPMIGSDELIDRFLADCDSFLERTYGYSKYEEQIKDSTVIFEGAQGLLLDQGNDTDYPFLTPSKTDLTNVMLLVGDFRIDTLQPYFVSRTYLTRHGAGPLPNEREMGMVCQTNKTNPWQGQLRYAPLDVQSFTERTSRVMTQFGVAGYAAFTHTDAGEIPIIGMNGEEKIVDASEIPHMIVSRGMGHLVSKGPSSKDVEYF